MRSAAEIPADVYSEEARANPLGFYRQHCAGWTQEELFTRVPLLYYRLWRKRHLHFVPGQHHPEFGGDAVAYYHEHYAGLTRGQLRDADSRCYEHLRRHGLLGPVPLKPRVSFPDPRAYFREHCAGMTRQQVAMTEPQFYNYLKRHCLLNALPFAARRSGGRHRPGRRAAGAAAEAIPRQPNRAGRAPPSPAADGEFRPSGVFPGHSGISSPARSRAACAPDFLISLRAMDRITDEESQNIYENFETYDLLRAVDQLDAVRYRLADQDDFGPPQIRRDLLKLHGLAMAVANEGETSAEKVAAMFSLAYEIDAEVFEMLESLEAIQDTLEKLTDLYPKSLEFYDG